MDNDMEEIEKELDLLISKGTDQGIEFPSTSGLKDLTISDSKEITKKEILLTE